MRMSARIRYAAALSAVALVTSAGAASAHHCYKEEWAEAAYQHHLAGGTAWMPLSDMATLYVLEPEGLAEACAWTADAAVADFMEMKGLTQEPLIHSKAIIGGGAFHKAGKAPKPINYLSDPDFEFLMGALFGYVGECLGGGPSA